MKILNKGDVLKCRKTYRALSEEEQRSFIMSFFTLSAYHHQGNFAAFFFLFECLNSKQRSKLIYECYSYLLSRLDTSPAGP